MAGPATSASLFGLRLMVVDRAGNVPITASRVRAVATVSGTFYGVPMTAGDIYTIAGGGKLSSGDGGPAVRASLAAVGAIALGPAGNVFIADGGLVCSVTP